MPTEKQIAAQVKRELAIKKREIITHVGDATMHLLHESSLNGSTLWPKKNFRAPAMANFDFDDIIEVRPMFHELTDDSAKGSLLFNMFNSDKKTARMRKQMAALQLIMDCAYLNDVLFEFKSDSIMGMGFTRLFGQMSFQFTYTPTQP